MIPLYITQNYWQLLITSDIYTHTTNLITISHFFFNNFFTYISISDRYYGKFIKNTTTKFC